MLILVMLAQMEEDDKESGDEEELDAPDKKVRIES